MAAHITSNAMQGLDCIATHNAIGKSQTLRPLSPRSHSKVAVSRAADAASFQHEEATPDPCREYRELFASLENAAAAKVAEVMRETSELTEPFIAYEVARTLPPGDALFVGNSMPIRDMDAFGGHRWKWREVSDSCMSKIEHGLGVPVAANRGASGIDGIISTAAGYAFGLSKAVTLVIGDVSFLHDVNGLSLLRTGEMRPPLTIVLINNGGGGIFDFLPIAQEVPEDTFTQLWSTPQNVDLAGICRAHGLAHQRVTKPEELSQALSAARGLSKHSIVEVITSRKTNVAQHRSIQESVRTAVLQALAQKLAEEEGGNRAEALPQRRDQFKGWRNGAQAAGRSLLQRLCSRQGDAQSPFSTLDLQQYKISAADYFSYKLPLRQALTSDTSKAFREGLVLRLKLERRQMEGRSPGDAERAFEAYGEVAPLPGLHKEDLIQAESQIAMLCELLKETPLDLSFFQPQVETRLWLWQTLGLRCSALRPSVIAGLEAALLSAASQALSNSITEIFQQGQSVRNECQPVMLSGLLDCSGSPEEAAAQALELVTKGYRSLKIKVARRQNPEDDARALLAIRRAVGSGIILRADANRRWSLPQALDFSQSAHSADLEYLEEPVKLPDDLQAFAKASQIGVALDETLDEILGSAESEEQAWQQLQGVIAATSAVALIIKPSLLPWGPSSSVSIARLASEFADRRPDQPRLKVVMSSAFETDLALAHYASLAAAVQPYQPSTPVHHGLGTSQWFSEKLLPSAPHFDGEQINLQDAQSLQTINLAKEGALMQLASRQPENLSVIVNTQTGTYNIGVKRWACQGQRGNHPTEYPSIIFLHGFLGDAQDWDPIAAAVSLGAQCFAVDLPGHGGSFAKSASQPASVPRNEHQAREAGNLYSIDSLADAVAGAINKSVPTGDSVLVAYSLGARVALHMLAKGLCHPAKVFLISATAGLEVERQCKARAASDDALADCLRSEGLGKFVRRWYEGEMWQTLMEHPRFNKVIDRRLSSTDIDGSALADVLSQASPGRMESLWAKLGHVEAEVYLIAGEHDRRYCALASKLENVLASKNAGRVCVKVAQDAGHAVHIERPECIAELLGEFLCL